ncbi:serine-type exopeptidase [Aureococcus anophagefferens]|nr:serine-type exopeptidase [Aureococcus anophagefferens]
MSFAVHVTFAASGTSPFTLRVAQPGDRPLTAKKVLKAFAAAYAKKTGEALDVASLGLRADAKAHADGGRLRRALSRPKPSVCYLGGSITEQRDGWRPRFHAWLAKRLETSVTAVDAFCGNAGSTLLAFTTKDWVIRAAPDAIFVEVAVNDGDCLLGAGGAATARGKDVSRALEGIVRGIREALPDAAIVFVEMFLRGDLPSARRSGTKAWVDAAAGDGAADVYSVDVVNAHGAVAARYGCAQLSLIDFFRGFPPRGLDALFRDDCHHQEAGADQRRKRVRNSQLQRLLSRPFSTRADYAAWAVAAGVEALLVGDAGGEARCPLPRPLDAAFWRSNGAHRFDGDPNFLTPGRPLAGDPPRGTADRCPVTGRPAAWTWLFAADGESARCHFDGTALGILTHVGPDSGRLAVSVDGGKPVVVDMVDEWCYYWRSTIVMLATGLERGFHDATITVLPGPPDRSRLKRPITDPNFLEHPHLGIAPKLWLMWFVSVGG